MLCHIKNHRTGIVFTMRLVEPGTRYGLNMSQTHGDSLPMVEFYDTRHAHDKDPSGVVLGQFVSRYYVESLLASHDGEEWAGLNLCGSVPDWSLDYPAMVAVITVLKNWGKF